MDLEKEAWAQYKRIRAKIEDAKSLRRKNPLVDNPPAIRGEKVKHRTWGDAKDTGYEGRHKK